MVKVYCQVTPGPSKLENLVDPGSGPRGPLPEIGVHDLNLDFQWTPPVETFPIFPAKQHQVLPINTLGKCMSTKSTKHLMNIKSLKVTED